MPDPQFEATFRQSTKSAAEFFVRGNFSAETKRGNFSLERKTHPNTPKKHLVIPRLTARESLLTSLWFTDHQGPSQKQESVSQ